MTGIRVITVLSIGCAVLVTVKPEGTSIIRKLSRAGWAKERIGVTVSRWTPPTTQKSHELKNSCPERGKGNIALSLDVMDLDCRDIATAVRVSVVFVCTPPVCADWDRVRRVGASADVAAVSVWIGVQVPLSIPPSSAHASASRGCTRPSPHLQSPSPWHVRPVTR